MCTIAQHNSGWMGAGTNKGHLQMVLRSWLVSVYKAPHACLLLNTYTQCRSSWTCATSAKMPVFATQCRRTRGHHLHGILVTHSDFDSLLCLHVQLGVLARLHGCLQAAHKGAGLQSLVGEVLELVQDDLSMHHHKALACSYLHHSPLCMCAGRIQPVAHLAL